MMGNRSPRTEKQLMAMRANAFVKGQAKHPGASSFAVGNSGNPRPGHPNRNKGGYKLTAETRARMSAGRKAMLAANPEFKAKLVQHALDVAAIAGTRRIEHLDVRGRLHRFRSTWEVRYAEALDGAGLAWFYEPDRLLLSDGRTYIPDFWVVDWNSYVEIKGQRWYSDKVEVARGDGYHVMLILGRNAFAEALKEMEN